MLKWVTLIVFSVVVLAAILIGSFGGYDIDVNPKDLRLTIRQARAAADIAHPKLAEAVQRHMSKSTLINARRRGTYTVTSVSGKSVKMDLLHEVELQNLSDNLVEHEAMISSPKGSPLPTVSVDSIALNPAQVTPTSPEESIHVYKISVPGRRSKVVTYRRPGLMVTLPHASPDLTTLPTLYAEIIIEGPADVMKLLRINTVAFTWRDNWEMFSPALPPRIVHGWRTRQPLFPYQGVNVLIDQASEK